MFSTFTLKTGLRAIGDMRRLFYISFATMVLNLVIDPFLIFPRVHIGPFPVPGLADPLILPGAGLGVAGAAWGTVIAFGSVFTLALIMFFGGWTYLKVKPRHFLDLSWDTARRIIRIGVPPATANFIEHIANVIVGAAIMTYGTTVFAGQGVNQILKRLLRVTVMGINISVITLVGQNLGARNPRRAELSALCGYGVVAVLMLLIGGLFFAAAPWIARLFVPGTDAESLATAEWAVRILRINAFVMLPFGLNRIGRAAFQGSGDTRPALYSTLASSLGVQLPLTIVGVYLLRFEDPRFIWWTEAGAYAIGAVLLYFVFRQGRWKQHRV
jgi:Na+-driven multidrug efflux pump